MNGGAFGHFYETSSVDLMWTEKAQMGVNL
jgi:hypothetical protein